MTTNNNNSLRTGFLHWIALQRTNLKELLHVLTAVPNDDNDHLNQLAEKNIQHLTDYHLTRSNDTLSIFSPSWCTSFENSLFWIGGFKPSIYIRLLYSIFESESENLDIKLPKMCNGESSKCGGEYSGKQVQLIKALHANTVSSEEMISSRMANLQECITGEPLIITATNNGSDHEVERALAGHRVVLGGIVVDADELRVTVLRELIRILTPLQGIHLLVASNRLHLSIHEWGKCSDRSTVANILTL
uniref:TGA5 n=1 Tax=Artemisia annua TaxID=35608 RepID=A0A481P8E1_ARTAN|nr:TGA5 [Artemisia annua]